MRYTKYHPRHGHVTAQTGGSLFEMVGSLLGKLPSGVSEAIKQLPGHIAKAGSKAAGEKIGARLADKIIPEKPKKSAAEVGPAYRKEVLKELKLLPEEKQASAEQYGFGRHRKVRGGGLKILT